jgi:hypothetical protein
MKALFSQRQHSNWIDVSSELLYSVVDAYDPDPGSPPQKNSE